MAAFVGVCRVHRAELMQLNGAWEEALEEARRACERCLGINRTAAATAYYQQGEIHRLRGEFGAAEAAYHNASQWGRDPQPGLALLRLAQGRGDAAQAAIRRALAETSERAQRAGLLAAQMEIPLAAGAVEQAGSACRELEQIASSFEARVLNALADQARGALELAHGDALEASGRLRGALHA
jgi:tetratricopeptide (TPR) repeat protein